MKWQILVKIFRFEFIVKASKISLKPGLQSYSLPILLVFLTALGSANAQIQIGTVKGKVTDITGSVLVNARVVLANPITGYSKMTKTDVHGEFVYNHVPFDRYIVRVDVDGFRPTECFVHVRSNLPVTLQLVLSVAGIRESITIEGQRSLIEEDSSSTKVRVDEAFIQRAPGLNRNRQVQALIATTPGWMTGNNGLLHIRGVDDGILYVVDGIPTADRIDASSASAFDRDMIQSFRVITGNIPAEFGGRSGAVVTIQSNSGIDLAPTGTFSLGAGNFRGGEISQTLGATVNKSIGFFITTSAGRLDRFLDPVDPRNFHNHGGTAKLNVRSDWHPTGKDIVLLGFSVNGTDFQVPNDLQQELAAQRQRQELRDNNQSISWQHTWSTNSVGNFAYFRRSYEVKLFGSIFDIPVFARQDRRHTRQGIISSVTHFRQGHTFKTGVEAARVTPREFFTFAVTDEETAEGREVSQVALEFGPKNPFVFRDREVGGLISWYIQDLFSPVKSLTVNVGLRYDHSSLPVSDQQFSPRVGAVYHVSATRTAIRGSFNRLYMPPQVENLLLADSHQARQLSPFATEEGGGGAPIRPEKVSAYESGLSQDVLGIFKLDAAYWWRFFRNFDDPNVFFNTTIIFPNSVAKGFARGVDVRIDVPERRGWSGYLSYTNARILQTGPINGGLFLTKEFLEIGPGTRFIPDHDQRNVGSFAVTYNHRSSGLWASFSGRHESGVPLEVEEERLEGLRSAPGSDLVDFERERVKPWTVFDFSAGLDLFRKNRVTVRGQFDIQNIANTTFAYNFGNPFEGTHFGHPRLWSTRIKFIFH